MRTASLFVMVALTLLVAASVATAGTVTLGSVRNDSKYPSDMQALFFRAAPGERNVIAVTHAMLPNGYRPVMLHDAAASVQATAPCTAIDEHTATCEATRAFVDAGDRNDAVTVDAAAGGYQPGDYVRGGDGDDILTGEGFLAGGAGNDVVTGAQPSCVVACQRSVFVGGAGDDVVRGTSADDLLSGDGDGPPASIGWRTVITEGATGNDVLDGGAGEDELTYASRRTDVRVDLAAGVATGAGGERDRLTGVENVASGDGDDAVLGSEGANVLEGGPGNDRVDGRGGDDYLLGNLVPDLNEFSWGYTPPDPGADTLHGESGRDRLDAGSERGDALFGGPGADILRSEVGGASYPRVVRCGSGVDKIALPLNGQLLTDCERLSIGVIFELRPALRPRRRLRFRWNCVRASGDREPCALAIGVRTGRSPLARRAVSARRGAYAFGIRPRRTPRRGDIVDITLLVDTGPSPPAAARWRIAL